MCWARFGDARRKDRRSQITTEIGSKSLETVVDVKCRARFCDERRRASREVKRDGPSGTNQGAAPQLHTQFLRKSTPKIALKFAILGLAGGPGRGLERPGPPRGGPGGFRAHLGASWARLGAAWGRLGAVLGPSWGRLGASCGRLGASWGRLGAPRGPLGPVLGGPGAVPGRSWAVLGASWRALGVSWAGSL